MHSVGSNAEHGLPRTNADKRHAVTLLLNDEEWVQWSDREIARRCAVHHVFVGDMRRSLVTVTSEKPAKTYTTKHGTTAMMNTENIGKGRAYMPLAQIHGPLRRVFLFLRSFDPISYCPRIFLSKLPLQWHPQTQIR
jgi:hypothetical protein